jgi:acyl-CoA hydrolase
MSDSHPLLDRVVEDVLGRVGSRVRLATPLGIGKPNALVDAFYRRAKADPKIDLQIFTALSLARPHAAGNLERRFAGPILERVFGTYPDPQFALDMLKDELPANVRVTSFYDSPGSALRSEAAQRNHISTNYTHVVRDIIEAGVNVLAQLVAVAPPGEEAEEAAAVRATSDGSSRGGAGSALSLSSNPDLTLDLLPHLMARRKASGRSGSRAASGGESSGGKGSAASGVALIAQVNRQLPYMYGDALVARDTFDHVLDDPSLEHDLFGAPNQPVVDTDYAIALNASVLIKDGGTIQLGIGSLGDAVAHLLLLRHNRNAEYRRVVDAMRVAERHADAIARIGGMDTFEQGLHGSSEMLMLGLLELVRGGVIRRPAENGALLNAAFFLGPRAFYQCLRDMSPEDRKRIGMTRVSYVNELFGEEERKRRERPHARFLNAGLVATLLGAVASDGLDDGRVISGVGGQYNFVSMAHELEGGRGILMIRAVRESGGKSSSNIRLTYGHTTIPRHLRDIVVTEYGIADLRGKSDEDVVKAMLAVSDSRFQDELIEEATKSEKLAKGYEVPDAFRANTPERVRDCLAPFRTAGTLPEYPFGTDLTDLEVKLARALRYLKRTLSGDLALPELEDLKKTINIPDEAEPYLERLGLTDPEGVEERVLRRAVVYGLAAENLI